MPATEEITIAEQYHDLLATNYFGLLSTVREQDGFISTNPVGYVWNGVRLRISTLKSRIKYRNLLANPLVTFCVVSQRDLMEYIEIRGYATVEDDPGCEFHREQFKRSAGEDPPEDLDPPGAERVIITIHPHQVSSPRLYGGRFHK